MSDQSNVLSRIVRWSAIGLLICVAIGLYFQMGTHITPFAASTHAGGSADTAP